MSQKPSSKRTTVSKRVTLSLNIFLVGIVCVFLVGIVTWTADTDSPQESLKPNPQNSNYNQLVQGFQSGQLNMKISAPPGFTNLDDPYDPMKNFAYLTEIRDTTYYHGKFYIYYGIAPALVLFWPYVMVSGHYLSDRCAVAVLFALGFLVIWWLLWDVRRRYFPEISSAFLIPAILMPGLVLALTFAGTVHEVTITFGFAFAMLALTGIWLALHSPARKNLWLLLASLAYGLAVGSRTSLLFGAIILLVPLLQSWLESPATVGRRRIAISVLSVIGPITLIGFGLMVYNDLRFGSFFEFGRRYQLTGDYESTTANQFGWHYLWFNVRYYFLEPISANVHFPFLQDVLLPSTPSGHDPSSEAGSILFNYPFIAFIFAIPLVWRGEPLKAASSLRWFLLALFLLFATCALTDCFFLASQVYYEMDFLPPLVVLAFIGFLGLDRALVHSQSHRHIFRLGWCLLLGYSLVFNLFTNVKAHTLSCYSAGYGLLNGHQPDAAIPYLQNAISLEPRVAMYHDRLAQAYAKTSQPDEKILSELRSALKIDPQCVTAEADMGYYLFRIGQKDEAYHYLEKTLEADPMQTNVNWAFDNAANARLLANDPEPDKTNQLLAVELAETACHESQYKEKQILLVSAVVCGQNGRTKEAISLAQKIVAEAQQDGDSNVLVKGQFLLNYYMRKQP
jgi:tetratricopeptide (TPR) repeat protein